MHIEVSPDLVVAIGFSDRLFFVLMGRKRQKNSLQLSFKGVDAIHEPP